MSCRTILILLLVGLLAVQTTKAQPDPGFLSALTAQISSVLQSITNGNAGQAGLLGAVTAQISSILQSIANGNGDPSLVGAAVAQVASILQSFAAANTNCGILKDGKQYYLKSADGRFAVVDANRQLALMNQASTSPSKFTVVQKSCNVYGLCVDGFCMSRCEACPSDLGDYQSVKFHVKDSDNPWSQWKLTNVSDRVGVFNLKVDANFGFLTYKRTRAGTAQLALNTTLTDKSQFQFIEVVENCGIILEDGKQYYLRQVDFRYAVFNPVKNLAFLELVPQTSASKFTAVRKSCNVYGFCIGDACMSRCEGCESDTHDMHTVRFHLNNTDSSWSQWTLTSPEGQYGGPYSLTAESQFGNLIYKTTLPNYEDQLTLEVTDEISTWNRFEFVEVN